MTRTRVTVSTPRFHGALLASAAIAVVLSAPVARAQTVEGLRLASRTQSAGDTILNRRLLNESAGELTGTARSDYVPESEGAVADEELQDPPLYGETAGPADSTATDLFELNRRPEAPRLPLGAAARASESSQTTFDDLQADPQAEDRATSARGGSGTADRAPSASRAASLPGQDEEGNAAVGTDSVRTGTVDGQSPEADENPYAAVGIRAGSFILRPSLETGVTATTNADSAAGGSAGVISKTLLRLQAASDWLRHAATLDASFAWEHPVSPAGPGRPEINVDGTLRLDLAGDHQIDAAAGYALVRESADSPVPIPATASRPYRHTIDTSLAISKAAGKLRYSLTGDLARDVYSDAALVGGGTLSQGFRNNTLATLTLRAGYEISPAIVPFAEAAIGRRFYDQKIDPAGYARSANRLALRGGVELDFGEKLTGEVAVGWLREAFDDPTLAAISGASIDGNLVWSPQRGTTVTLAGQTTVEQTTTAGSSGSVFYSGSLGLEHQLRTNLTGTALVSAGLRDYAASSDRDLTFAAELGFTWWLNRYAGVTGRARHERLASTISGRAYTANSVFLGLKLQR